MQEPKKTKRPDTPLAVTPLPVGMQQEQARQAAESIKGSSFKFIQQSKAKKAAEKATKEADSKSRIDSLSRTKEY